MSEWSVSLRQLDDQVRFVPVDGHEVVSRVFGPVFLGDVGDAELFIGEEIFARRIRVDDNLVVTFGDSFLVAQRLERERPVLAENRGSVGTTQFSVLEFGNKRDFRTVGRGA